MEKIVNILGTPYKVILKKYSDEPLFEQRSIDGYSDDIAKEIVVCDMTTQPQWENTTKELCEKYERLVTRHEVIHAFLSESGLQSSSLQYSGGWAKNEEMVDFFAIQMPKIIEVFTELEILD